MNWNSQNLIRVLKDGGIAVMPTDTLYGIVGRAENSKTVRRIYEARKRDPSKPCIILIGNVEELEKFSVSLTPFQQKEIKEYWPGPVSIILDCPDKTLEYLHRGTFSLAFRVPGDQSLRELLLEVGPIVAPSANTEGLPPAKTIYEAQNYFGKSADLYVTSDDEESMQAKKPSKVIKIDKKGSITILRP